jgi:hypothetical protein
LPPVLDKRAELRKSDRRSVSGNRRQAGMSSMRLALVAIVVLVVGGWAHAAVAADTLDGEFYGLQMPFHGQRPAGETLSATCTPQADGTFTYAFAFTGAQFPAGGPFPGSWIETGTATWGPAIFPVSGLPPVGDPLSLAGSFTITAPNGTVVGTLALSPVAPAIPAFGDFGFCSGAWFMTAHGAYTASITTTSGTTIEHGRAVLNISSPDGRASTSFSAAAGNLSLLPATATVATGSIATVTATVTSAAGAPLRNRSVLVSTDSGPVDFCTTDASGQCSFSYQAPASFTGVDHVTACTDLDFDITIDPLTDTCGTASVTWTSPDANGNGVYDSIEVAGSNPPAFDDGAGTTGSVGSNPDGLPFVVADAASSADGVSITVGGTAGAVSFTVCAGYPISIGAGSIVTLTCGSVRLTVVSGRAQVILGGGLTTITIPAGDTGYVNTNPDGSYVVKNLDGSAPITITEGGVTSTVPAGGHTTVQAWRFTGFSQPVENNGVLNAAKAGRVIPLKWRIVDAANRPVLTLSSAGIATQSLDCPGGTPTADIPQSTAGASGLQNLGNGYYQLNWSVPKAYAGSCKTMVLDIGDGVTHTARFDFTK